MYKTVTSMVKNLGELTFLDRQLLPAMISMAACGEHERVRDVLRQLPAHAIADELWAAMAKNLSAYAPETSLEILERMKFAASPFVQVLILLRAGRIEDALSSIRNFMGGSMKDWSSDLLLLRLACGDFYPKSGLDILNLVFKKFDLPFVELLDARYPAYPGNLRVTDDLPTANGPLISVIMTAFNSSARIRHAIGSILNQTYKNIELIVVDDLSTDGTRDIVREIARQDGRVRLLSLNHNVGTYCAKTIGAGSARGDFITCMDSDDWSHPAKLAMQVQPLLDDSRLVATASCGIRLFDDGTFDVTYTVSSKLVRLSYPSLLFRKEKVRNKAGLWDSAVRINADVEFLARLKLHFGPEAIRLLPQPLSVMSRNDSSLTGNTSSSGFGQRRFPQVRLDYVESFNEWHISSLRSGNLPVVMEDPEAWLDHHPFDVPAEMRVDRERVRRLIVQET
jgi:hypothetical protein